MTLRFYGWDGDVNSPQNTICIWLDSKNKLGYCYWDTECGYSFDGEVDISVFDFSYCMFCGRRLTFKIPYDETGKTFREYTLEPKVKKDRTGSFFREYQCEFMEGE